MNIEQIFDFLVTEYKLTYVSQMFTKCYGGNWAVETHSFFNETGCFTIYRLMQGDELEFYCSRQFSNTLKELCEQMVDVCKIEPELWEARSKFLGLKRPFFWWNKNKVLCTLAEALKTHLSQSDSFWGIRV